MTYKDLYLKLIPLYEPSEARAIVRMLLETEFGFSQADLYTDKVNQLPAEHSRLLARIIERLANAEPVQYVLGRTEFFGRWFKVNPNVLIPRPETEDLCRWILSDITRPFCGLQPPPALKILDIGTGSGCIAVTLALDTPNAQVSAWDISADALLTARENAINLNAAVNFQLVDALNPPPISTNLNIIVSNPPYITEHEKQTMEPNVIRYEPATALFVPDSNPLLFYRAISLFGMESLQNGGAIYFETNPNYLPEIHDLLTTLNYTNIETHADRFTCVRFIKAIKK